MREEIADGWDLGRRGRGCAVRGRAGTGRRSANAGFEGVSISTAVGVRQRRRPERTESGVRNVVAVSVGEAPPWAALRRLVWRSRFSWPPRDLRGRPRPCVGNRGEGAVGRPRGCSISDRPDARTRLAEGNGAGEPTLRRGIVSANARRVVSVDTSRAITWVLVVGAPDRADRCAHARARTAGRLTYERRAVKKSE